MAKKEKKTIIQLEDKRLMRGPRKPKGGGYHEDSRDKRKGNRSQKNKIKNWEETEED